MSSKDNLAILESHLDRQWATLKDCLSLEKPESLMFLKRWVDSKDDLRDAPDWMLMKMHCLAKIAFYEAICRLEKDSIDEDESVDIQ